MLGARSRLFHAIVVMGLSVGCSSSGPPPDDGGTGGDADASKPGEADAAKPTDAAPTFDAAADDAGPDAAPDAAQPPCCWGPLPDGAPCPFPCYV